MKNAFTMLELIFVIVVVGILAAVIIPNTKSSPEREAAIQLVSHIRYTQHLAMVDDKFDASDASWYKNRWQIVFNGNQYSIVSDNNTRFALNPINRDENLSNIDLDEKYSTSIALSGGCNGQISFDHLGRPLNGDLNTYTSSYTITATGQLMTATCVITLTNGAENVIINVEPETGYAHII